jgi:3-oxoacyl-[acyl-carrier protein] reductase
VTGSSTSSDGVSDLASLTAVSDGVTVERVGAGVVVRPQFDRRPRAFESLGDDDWERAFEQPVQATIEALAAAFDDGVKRIVVVVPTLGMSGGAHYSHVAAPAEAIRVLVKAVARSWGRDGVTINAVALGSHDFVDAPDIAGPQTLAPASLPTADPTAVIEFLCSEAAADVTGQTVVVDGGLLM